jgi:hypothetical protein
MSHVKYLLTIFFSSRHRFFEESFTRLIYSGTGQPIIKCYRPLEKLGSYLSNGIQDQFIVSRVTKFVQKINYVANAIMPYMREAVN